MCIFTFTFRMYNYITIHALCYVGLFIRNFKILQIKQNNAYFFIRSTIIILPTATDHYLCLSLTFRDNLSLHYSLLQHHPINVPSFPLTWWRGRPTMDGKTARGASSPAKPALHMPEPLSQTRAATSSSAIAITCWWRDETTGGRYLTTRLPWRHFPVVSLFLYRSPSRRNRAWRFYWVQTVACSFMVMTYSPSNAG